MAESRAETLAMAAHELKTPLAIIKGCATTLLGGSARWEPAMQREMLQMIDVQSDHLYDVLNTLLDVWRFDAGTQPLRLAQIQLSELLSKLSSAGKIRLQTSSILDLPPDVPPIVCDALRIEQVLNHLLNNAVAYSPINKVIRLQLEASESEVRVSVTDEGIGIASEHLDRIFDRFYRVQSDEESTTNASYHSGLGLAAARATIEAHEGKIWADLLGLGLGSTFCFTLPFAPRTSIQIQRLPVSTDQQSTTSSVSLKQDRRTCIVVAENDARFGRYIVRIWRTTNRVTTLPMVPTSAR